MSEERKLDFPTSLYVDANALPWRPSPHPGVEWKKLRFDGRGSVVLLRFAPGASYGAHRHPEGEEYWVIEGSIIDGGRTHGPGTWIEHPPGSVHRPRSADGCLLLVRLPAPIEPTGGAGSASDAPAIAP
jgi:anti-sigma factor ChrR (cupin superfamily)